MTTIYQEFAVRSLDFAQYQKFSTQANKIGWKFRKLGDFDFSPKSMEQNDCLYFHSNWDKGARYAFSNAQHPSIIEEEPTLIFNLDSEVGFSQAVKWLEGSIKEIKNINATNTTDTIREYSSFGQ